MRPALLRHFPDSPYVFRRRLRLAGVVSRRKVLEMGADGMYVGDSTVAECFGFHAEDCGAMGAVVEHERLNGIDVSASSLNIQIIC